MGIVNTISAKDLKMEYLKAICNIIQTEMNLGENNVWIYNQKRDIPNDFGLYIVVSEVGSTLIGSKLAYDTTNGFEEVQSVHSLNSVDINIFSRSSQARTRKNEVIMALNSTYSQQVQEANSFSIGRISSSFTNTSELEETAEMNRFTINFNVTNMTQKRKAVNYYDTFSKNVITEA